MAKLQQNCDRHCTVHERLNKMSLNKCEWRTGTVRVEIQVRFGFYENPDPSLYSTGYLNADKKYRWFPDPGIRKKIKSLSSQHRTVHSTILRYLLSQIYIWRKKIRTLKDLINFITAGSGSLRLWIRKTRRKLNWVCNSQHILLPWHQCCPHRCQFAPQSSALGTSPDPPENNKEKYSKSKSSWIK